MEWARIQAKAPPRVLAGALKRLGVRGVRLSPSMGVFAPASDELWNRLSRINPAASPSAEWPEPLPGDAVEV